MAYGSWSAPEAWSETSETGVRMTVAFSGGYGIAFDKIRRNGSEGYTAAQLQSIVDAIGEISGVTSVSVVEIGTAFRTMEPSE